MKPFKSADTYATDFWFLGGVMSTVQDPDVIQARLIIREIRKADPSRED